MQAFITIDLVKSTRSGTAKNVNMAIGEVVKHHKLTEQSIFNLPGAKQIPVSKVGG